ncbi:dicarboxylate/amino acid:cation symporter [soil metagenome]|nr:dicarboxylate/amino acid:cation symporter [Gemmatimonadota bacterium]MDQ3606814.1 dicarboxylate/amino acid:cation symporter [Gemmatimonadota bacterium]
MQLYTKISIGLVAGAVVGTAVNALGLAATPAWSGAILPLLQFVGNAFIRAITMIVIPLVVASLLVGVASLGDLRKLGRMGGKTLAYYMMTTAIAITIGLTLALLVKPGSRIAPASRDALAQEFSEAATGRLQLAAERPSTWDVLLNMIPDNPIAAAAEGNLLPLIIFVILFGAAVTLLLPERRHAIITLFQGINDASMIIIDWIMKLAPYAVFALIAAVISRFGIDVLQSLAIYTLVVIAGLLIHAFGTYGTLVALLARLNPLEFFRRIREVPLIAFSTSSSNATLPVTMETAEEQLGVSKSVSSFVLPLGATINMDGTALYQGVATVFIAQVYAVQLGLDELLTIVLTATLASIGAAGVPSAGIITLILVLQSVGMAGQAAAGIALILGVDRILDMIRTAVNVTGDLSCSAFVARSEGEDLMPHPRDHAFEMRPVPELQEAGEPGD